MLKVNPASSAPTDGTLRPNVPHASAAGQCVLLTGGFYSSISNCSYTPFATCRNNFARGSESTGVVHRIGFLIFFLCVDEMNRQFWAQARVSGADVCFASGAIASRRWDSAASLCLSVFPTSFFNNDGGVGLGSFHFQQVICHRFGRLCSQERLGSPHGDGGGRVATCFVGFVLRFVLGVFFIVCCALLSSAPFVRLRFWRTASQGRGGQGGLWDGCLVPGGFSELGWTSVRVPGFHCLILP